MLALYRIAIEGWIFMIIVLAMVITKLTGGTEFLGVTLEMAASISILYGTWVLADVFKTAYDFWRENFE